MARSPRLLEATADIPPPMCEFDRLITEAAGEVPGISSLVVFGTRADGRPRPTSDLDVGVLPDTPDSEARRKLQARVAVALADLAPAGRVDVVLLDEAPPLLRHRILSSGRLLICRDREAWTELLVRTMREHGDREWVYELLIPAQRRRLTEGLTDGRPAEAVESLERLGRLSC
ncbi:MAG: type VII toxin-antitoxin system MntA family adenylyltransferase antitoxin [Candidatus Rokuibacteriota bacterium]